MRTHLHDIIVVRYYFPFTDCMNLDAVLSLAKFTRYERDTIETLMEPIRRHVAIVGQDHLDYMLKENIYAHTYHVLNSVKIEAETIKKLAVHAAAHNSITLHKVP